MFQIITKAQFIFLKTQKQMETPIGNEQHKTSGWGFIRIITLLITVWYAGYQLFVVFLQLILALLVVKKLTSLKCLTMVKIFASTSWKLKILQTLNHEAVWN